MGHSVAVSIDLRLAKCRVAYQRAAGAGKLPASGVFGLHSAKRFAWQIPYDNGVVG